MGLSPKGLGPDSPGVANSLHQLGNIYHLKGDYPKAETAFLRALTIREKTSGPVSNDVFALLSGLGGLNFDRLGGCGLLGRRGRRLDRHQAEPT